MERFDCIVIGGGILGLSVAWAIIQKNPSACIAVLEKEDDWASHQTGPHVGIPEQGETDQKEPRAKGHQGTQSEQ